MALVQDPFLVGFFLTPHSPNLKCGAKYLLYMLILITVLAQIVLIYPATLNGLFCMPIGSVFWQSFTVLHCTNNNIIALVTLQSCMCFWKHSYKDIVMYLSCDQVANLSKIKFWPFPSPVRITIRNNMDKVSLKCCIALQLLCYSVIPATSLKPLPTLASEDRRWR